MKKTNKISFKKSQLNDEVSKRIEENCIKNLQELRNKECEPAHSSRRPLLYICLALFLFIPVIFIAVSSFDHETPGQRADPAISTSTDNAFEEVTDQSITTYGTMDLTTIQTQSNVGSDASSQTFGDERLYSTISVVDSETQSTSNTAISEPTNKPTQKHVETTIPSQAIVQTLPSQIAETIDTDNSDIPSTTVFQTQIDNTAETSNNKRKIVVGKNEDRTEAGVDGVPDNMTEKLYKAFLNNDDETEFLITVEYITRPVTINGELFAYSTTYLYEGKTLDEWRLIIHDLRNEYNRLKYENKDAEDTKKELDRVIGIFEKGETEWRKIVFSEAKKYLTEKGIEIVSSNSEERIFNIISTKDKIFEILSENTDEEIISYNFWLGHDANLLGNDKENILYE